MKPPEYCVPFQLSPSLNYFRARATLHNTNNAHSILFKIKTNETETTTVVPNIGCILPGNTEDIAFLVPKEGRDLTKFIPEVIAQRIPTLKYKLQTLPVPSATTCDTNELSASHYTELWSRVIKQQKYDVIKIGSKILQEIKGYDQGDDQIKRLQTVIEVSSEYGGPVENNQKEIDDIPKQNEIDSEFVGKYDFMQQFPPRDDANQIKETQLNSKMLTRPLGPVASADDQTHYHLEPGSFPSLIDNNTQSLECLKSLGLISSRSNPVCQLGPASISSNTLVAIQDKDQLCNEDPEYELDQFVSCLVDQAVRESIQLVPKKCSNDHSSKAKVIEKYADKVAAVWLKQGYHESANKLLIETRTCWPKLTDELSLSTINESKEAELTEEVSREPISTLYDEMPVAKVATDAFGKTGRVFGNSSRPSIESDNSPSKDLDGLTRTASGWKPSLIVPTITICPPSPISMTHDLSSEIEIEATQCLSSLSVVDDERLFEDMMPNPATPTTRVYFLNTKGAPCDSLDNETNNEPFGTYEDAVDDTDLLPCYRQLVSESHERVSEDVETSVLAIVDAITSEDSVSTALESSCSTPQVVETSNELSSYASENFRDTDNNGSTISPFTLKKATSKVALITADTKDTSCLVSYHLRSTTDGRVFLKGIQSAGDSHDASTQVDEHGNNAIADKKGSFPSVSRSFDPSAGSWVKELPELRKHHTEISLNSLVSLSQIPLSKYATMHSSYVMMSDGQGDTEVEYVRQALRDSLRSASDARIKEEPHDTGEPILTHQSIVEVCKECQPSKVNKLREFPSVSMSSTSFSDREQKQDKLLNIGQLTSDIQERLSTASYDNSSKIEKGLIHEIIFEEYLTKMVIHRSKRLASKQIHRTDETSTDLTRNTESNEFFIQ